jgi:hypothetical protein
MFNDKELSRLRALANSVVSLANTKGEAFCQIAARRNTDHVHMTLSYRPGTVLPSDSLSYLGDLADAIRSELRLEQTPWGTPLYRTSESEFETGARPEFRFSITKSGAGDEES